MQNLLQFILKFKKDLNFLLFKYGFKNLKLNDYI